MAQPRIKGPSLQELLLASRTQDPTAAALEGATRGIGLSSKLLANQQEREARIADARARATNLKAQLAQSERGVQLKERAEEREISRAPKKEARAEAKAAAELRKTEADIALAEERAKLISRQPGAARLIPKSDVDLSSQATKEVDAFLKTSTAGAGAFGTPDLEIQRQNLIDQRFEELKAIRDQVAVDNLVAVQRGDGATGKVPKEKLQEWLDANPGSKVIK